MRTSPRRTAIIAPIAAMLLCGALAAQPAGPVAQDGPDDWASAERGCLENHVQLTFPDRFYKAGESYFSVDDSKVIFQAVPRPPEGVEPAEFYDMYVADVHRGGGGRITGLSNLTRMSRPGSANTCGWFDPVNPGVVLFASTIGAPSPGAPPGYDRRSGRYRWMFPPEMRIIRMSLDDTARSHEHVAGGGDAYCAEGALSPDGRHLVYCSLQSGGGDLYVLDTQTGRTACVVAKPGYDGGPFFSPDGRRICYRSDRQGNHLLQVFVADLAFDAMGTVVGVVREHQLTDNGNVNWAPFWHPEGRHLVYATSEVGHYNYEVFMIDADPGTLPGSSGSLKYGTRKRRVTHAARADVLPAFTHDGKTMFWTSQRGEGGKSQLWVADFVIDLDPKPATGGYDRSQRSRGTEGGH